MYFFTTSVHNSQKVSKNYKKIIKNINVIVTKK